jgi:DNA-binding IclR family transcriptional regulator
LLTLSPLYVKFKPQYGVAYRETYKLLRKAGRTLSKTIRAVERALEVLLCFSRQTPELTLTEIAERIGIHKSTVHRMLATLEAKRFVERDESTGAYRLGINVLQMAYLTLNHNDLRQVAARHLRHLCEQYRETVNLSILDGPDVIYLDVVESPQRVKLAASVGQRLPAFCTASGKAILAYSPEGIITQVLDQGMHQHTQCTLDTPEKFYEDMEKTRNRGFAISLEEFEDGINAIAAPILNQNKHPIASVAIAGPSYRLSKDRMLEIGSSVLSAVHDIAREVEITMNT